MQTEPTRKVEKKEKQKRRLWTTDANRLQITVNLKKMRHLRRAFQRFCASAHPSYKCYMLENLAFFHNSFKTPDDADIANCKHYSAPAGALTMFSHMFAYFHIFARRKAVIRCHRFPSANARRHCILPFWLFLFLPWPLLRVAFWMIPILANPTNIQPGHPFS